MARTAILDIDGTLVDTNYQHAIAWYRAFRRHGIALEWVYVAKMLYGVFDLAQSGRLASGATVVAVITGPPGP